MRRTIVATQGQLLTNFFSPIDSFSIYFTCTVGQEAKDAMMNKIYCLLSILNLARDTDRHMYRGTHHVVLETALAGGRITEGFPGGSDCEELSSVQFSSVAQSCPTLCDPHELQHTRPPCPSPTSGVHPNPCPLSW